MVQKISVGIVDYGCGNVASVANMCRSLGYKVSVCKTENSFKQVDAIILPGVGAFDQGMASLNQSGLLGALEEARLQGSVILGVCLGMQLMCRSSEEGVESGLGWFDCEVKRIPDRVSHNNQTRRLVPHIGWNYVYPIDDSPFLEENSRFYFANSYCVSASEEGVIATVSYDGFDFAASIRKNNVIGAQFHPEKSHFYGKSFIRSVLEGTRL